MSELIARTNALTGFTARYRAANSEGEHGTLTLGYAAPDRGFFHLDVGETTARQWISGSQVTMHVKAPELHDFAIFDFASLSTESAAVKAELRAAFPVPPEPAKPSIGRGAWFAWSWSARDLPVDANSDAAATQSKGTNLGLSVGCETDRTHLLHWLASLERRKDMSAETSDEWIWNLPNGGEARVSKSSGFVTRVKLVKADGAGLEFELECLELSTPPPEILVAPQVAPEGARSNEEEIKAGLRRVLCLSARSETWNRVLRGIEAGRLIWDDGSEQKLTRVFRSLHSHFLRERAESLTPQAREWIDSSAGRLASYARKLRATDERGRARLNEERERAVDSMNETFGEDLRALLSLEAPDSVPATFHLMDEFLRCERAAACAEYERQVRGPLLAYFDEKFDAALAR